MKNKLITAAALSAVALTGSAVAQTAESNVVGYETLTINVGFNFFGIRLHQSPVASGDLETVNANDVEDADTDLGALMDGSTFILEIEDGNGVIQEVTTDDGGTGLATPDTSGIGSPVNYTLRPADTLASIFGLNNEAGLASGSFGGSGTADEVWLWNGSSFDKYYYDTFNLGTSTATWSNVDTTAAVDATAINLIYADSFVVNGKGVKTFVVDGDLKATETEIGLGVGFNFVGSVAPEGATISAAFGPNNEAGLASGSFGGSGTADEIWVWNGSAFDKYYFDTFNLGTSTATWSNVDTTAAVDGSTINLGSGYVINGKGAKDVTQSVPGFYAGL